MKSKTSMTKEEVDAYIKSFKTKPSLMTKVIATFYIIWVALFGLTAFVVVTKLMVEAWKWIL